MRKIVFDTSSIYLYVAFLENNEIMFERFRSDQNRHAENLLKEIQNGLCETGLKLSDFQEIYFGIGPGSYTGLRVSATVGKTMGWILGIPVFIAGSLDFLISGHLNAPGIYAITMKAKKDYVYAKVVRITNEGLESIIQDTFIEEDKFFSLIKQYDYVLINEKNYAVDLSLVSFTKVKNIHDLVPNYLRSGV